MTIRLSAQDRGFTLAGLLVLLAIMSIFLALAVPLWSRVKQRDNEEELIFRGNEFIKAIARYHQKFGIYPPDTDTLVKLKYLRHDYLDPMTKSGKWKVLHPDSLVQTGLAGTVNPQGLNTGQNQNPGSGQNTGTSGSQNRNRDRLSGGDDDDDDKNKDQHSDGLFGSDDDKNKDEEPEVESIGPVVGVVSRSKKASIRIYNGQTYYNKWTFIYTLQQQQQQRRPIPPGGGGTQGQPGRGGTPQGGTPPGQQGGTRPPTPPQQPQNNSGDDGGGRN